jgi:hypothetical protein
LTFNKHVLNLKFNTDIPLNVIILSVIHELPLSVWGVGRRTQPISKLLNDLLITSALNPTCLLQVTVDITLVQDDCYSITGPPN